MDKKDEKMDKTDESQKQDQAAVKSVTSKPALKQPRWPGQGGNSGIKNAKSVHGRMSTTRGSARGR